MNGDPRRGHGLIALAFNFRHPSFDSHGGRGRESGWPRTRRSERRTEREGERLVQVVHQSQDLFDAVFNGRLEIKKLRINASWGLVGQSSLFFFFLFFLFFFSPPPLSFYSSFVSPLLLFFPSSLPTPPIPPSSWKLSPRRARLIPGRKANFASVRSFIDEGLCQVLQSLREVYPSLL